MITTDIISLLQSELTDRDTAIATLQAEKASLESSATVNGGQIAELQNQVAAGAQPYLDQIAAKDAELSVLRASIAQIRAALPTA